MNAVGIDVSKGKSMVAVMRPFGEVVASPFEVAHTVNELGKLADMLKSLNGETKVVLEYTGSYYQPVACVLHQAGLHVSVVHAKLIHDYGNNTIRKVKTDKADAIKIANYGLSNWLMLPKYIPEDDIRRTESLQSPIHKVQQTEDHAQKQLYRVDRFHIPRRKRVVFIASSQK